MSETSGCISDCNRTSGGPVSKTSLGLGLPHIVLEPQVGQCLIPPRGQGIPLIVLEPQGGRCLIPQRGQGLPPIVLEPKGSQCLIPPWGQGLTLIVASGGPISKISGGPENNLCFSVSSMHSMSRD